MKLTQSKIHPNSHWLFSKIFFCLSVLAVGIWDNSAHAHNPQMRINLSKLAAQGIELKSIKSALAVRMNSTPNTMILDETDNPQKLKLTKVNFYGDNLQGVWLKTHCGGKSPKFSLEECRGTFCQPTTPNLSDDSPKNQVHFQGEYGTYSVSRSDFANQLRKNITTEAETCRQIWPAWAVSARAKSISNALSFPQNALFIQTDERLLFLNAIDGQIWNSVDWKSELGIFTQVVVSGDGRLLLKNSSAEALYLNFRLGVFFSYSRNILASSFLGLNGLFGKNLMKNLDLTINTSQSGGTDTDLAEVNLAGLWWKTGYLSWNDIHSALVSKKIPNLREYPNAGSMLSVVWTEETGVETLQILLQEQNQLQLYSQGENSSAFRKIKAFNVDANNPQRASYFIHPNFLTSIENNGQIHLNLGDKTLPDLKTISKVPTTQSGFGLFTTLRHENSKNRCRMSYYVPKKLAEGWIEQIVIPNNFCAAGIGNSSAGAAIVELTPSHVNIHLIESSQ